MGEQKRKEQAKNNFLFHKENYKLLFIGLAFIAVGFILMSGGGSEDPNFFNAEKFNFRRIRLAPALVLIGFALQVFAILKKPKNQ